ncbi:hypothetical protein [Pigmentiphaga sp. CHJ604]|uniref:hypothetical protein n=1 Tax=Pigmentiphaga sp. CHJ604 TaxID=3081984 RepID=UPI0030D2C235
MKPFDLYQQAFPTPSAIELELYQLAQAYYLETEAFDRAVCTGPILHGEIYPATDAEHRLIQINARKVLARQNQRAQQLHPAGVEMLRVEMKRYARSGQRDADLATRFDGPRQFHP